jgi:hypothetical protein
MNPAMAEQGECRLTRPPGATMIRDPPDFSSLGTLAATPPRDCVQAPEARGLWRLQSGRAPSA